MKLSNNLSPEKLLQQSQSLQEAGKFEEAAIGFEKLSKLYPKYPPILNSLGIVYLQLGKFKEGCKLLEKSLQLAPNQARILFNLGRAYHIQNKFNEAIISYKKALKIEPDFIDAYENMGISGYAMGMFEDAVKCFDHMIRLNARSANGQNGRGISLYALGHYEASLISLDQALTINNASPEIYNNIGLTLHKLNKLDEAINHYNQAIQLNPNYADAYSNRGLSLQALRKTNEAINDFDRCLEINPNHADAHWNKGLIKILLGEYKEGWKLYEWRWKSFSKKWARQYKEPLWLGEESLKGKSILIYPEQGYGDFIQFYRYIPKLQELGAKVILETPVPLVGLITKSASDLIIIESGQKLPQFDFQCPIMSLPLGFKTSIDTIPNSYPYLSANTEKIKDWESKLSIKTKKRIGLAWSGSKDHKNDHNRSIELELLLPLLEMPFEFHSLQKEIRGNDQAFFEKSSIHDHQNDINDFSDTAALIENMDLVITVDTAIAHLAGSLNKPCFILLPFINDYRWMLNREDSPWYATARLFRATQLGNWNNVISELKQQL